MSYISIYMYIYLSICIYIYMYMYIYIYAHICLSMWNNRMQRILSLPQLWSGSSGKGHVLGGKIRSQWESMHLDLPPETPQTYFQWIPQPKLQRNPAAFLRIESRHAGTSLRLRTGFRSLQSHITWREDEETPSVEWWRMKQKLDVSMFGWTSHLATHGNSSSNGTFV